MRACYYFFANSSVHSLATHFSCHHWRQCVCIGSLYYLVSLSVISLSRTLSDSVSLSDSLSLSLARARSLSLALSARLSPLCQSVSSLARICLSLLLSLSPTHAPPQLPVRLPLIKPAMDAILLADVETLFVARRERIDEVLEVVLGHRMRINFGAWLIVGKEDRNTHTTKSL